MRSFQKAAQGVVLENNDNNEHLMRVPRCDAGGGRETTLSFGVA